MDRQQTLAKAQDAAYKAAALASQAQSYTTHADHKADVSRIAAAGALWADTARAYAAIAAVMPDTQPADDTTEA